MRLHYNLFLVNPNYANEEILGRKVYSSLKEIKEALNVKAKYIWFQPGSENIEALG